jgi:hypothetical protein
LLLLIVPVLQLLLLRVLPLMLSSLLLLLLLLAHAQPGLQQQQLLVVLACDAVTLLLLLAQVGVLLQHWLRQQLLRLLLVQATIEQFRPSRIKQDRYRRSHCCRGCLWHYLLGDQRLHAM